MNFCLMVKTQFDANVKAIRSDNGSEFTSGPMKKFYGEQGIFIKQVVLILPNKMVK